MSPTPPTRHGVIFDLDGLLVDTEPIWSDSARELLRRRHRCYDPSLKGEFLGRHPLDVATRMVAHYRLDDAPEDLLEERIAILEGLYRSGEIPLMPGAGALLAALQQREVPLAVASGSPDAVVLLVLESLNIIGYFKVILGSDAVERGKPAPDIFLLAARRLGLEPRRCVVVEDAPAGVAAALAAGMACLAVPAPEVGPEGVAGARRVLPSLEQASPELLQTLVAEQLAEA